MIPEYDRTPGSEDRPQLSPVDEHYELLEGRLAHAQKQLAGAQMTAHHAELQVAEWRPVAESCSAALKVLATRKEMMSATESKAMPS